MRPTYNAGHVKPTLSPADFGFNPDDLKPLGKTFVNDPPFHVEDSPSAFRVSPPRDATRRNVATWAFVGLFFVGGYVLVGQVLPASDRTMARAGIVAIGTMTCFYGYMFVATRQRAFERRGPVIDYDKATGRLSIPGGRVFERDAVVGLLCCALYHKGPDSGTLAELNLVAHVDGKRLRFLLLTSLDSSRHVFDYIAEPFVAATGLPAYRIWNDAWLGQGELRAEPVAAVNSPS